MEMKISDDVFVHFTTNENAKAIIDDGVIEEDPEGVDCFGAKGVFAISLTYGEFYETMINHNEDRDGDMVAIIFTTDDKPEKGFNEEVQWEEDVTLEDAFVCPFDDARNAIENSTVEYECNHLENNLVTYK
jgi:hypothetical protein